MVAKPNRPRSVIEAELRAARQDLELAEDDASRARDEIEELEDELDDLPPDGSDKELWAAQHDPRQLGLFGATK